MRQTKVLSMKNNRVQLLLNYEKESYGSCTGLEDSDKKIIVMFSKYPCKTCDPGEQFLVEVLYQISRLQALRMCPCFLNISLLRVYSAPSCTSQPIGMHGNLNFWPT